MFQKGVSGNPGGRPKISPDERKQWGLLAIRGREKLSEMLDDPETNDGIIVKITELAANRAWGTPVQAVELGDSEGGPIQLKVEYVGKKE